MKVITFRETGEVRIPKKGEWYRASEGKICKLRAVQYLLKPVSIYTMTESDVQTDAQCVSKDDALNTQKSLGVSEPSLVQENERLKKLQGEMNETLRNAMSSPKIPTMREQELDVKNFDQRMEIDSLTARLRLSEDRVKKYEEALEWLAYNIMELAKVKNKENFFVSKWRSYGCQEWGRDTVADGNTPLKAVQNAMALESQSLTKDEERK